jgi:hypothetical protein
LPFRISIDFAFLKNILSATDFSLICVPYQFAPPLASGGAFKLILQAFPETPGYWRLLCAMHAYQKSLFRPNKARRWALGPRRSMHGQHAKPRVRHAAMMRAMLLITRPKEI